MTACFKGTRGNFNIYQLDADSSWKLRQGTRTLKTFVSHTDLWHTVEKLDDLKSIGLMLLVI